MKIVYVGNFGVDFSTESHVAWSLEDLGHFVIRVQENSNTASDIVALCKTVNPDLFLWTRTWGVQGNALDMLNSMLCPSVAFHLDLYAGLQRNGNIDTDPWWKCDYVFSADGGSSDYFLEHKVNHYWSPPAVYGKECYLAEPVEEMKTQVLFTGSATAYHPEWGYRQLLVEKLYERYGNKFRLIEHGSPGAPWRGSKLNSLYASALVTVGDTLCINFNHEKYFSDRLTEQAGRGGGCQVFPYIRGIEDMYEIGKEILCYHYGDFEELFTNIDMLINDNDKRENMRIASMKRTISQHTYAHRMKNIIDVVINKKKSIWG